jgi:hypothetical protein
MSRLIVPFSDASEFLPGGKFAINAANFPVVKACWDATSPPVGNGWKDIVSGITVTCSLGWVQNGSGWRAGGNSAVQSADIAPVSVGSDNHVLLVVGTMSGALSGAGRSLSIGDPVNGPAIIVGADGPEIFQARTAVDFVISSAFAPVLADPFTGCLLTAANNDGNDATVYAANTAGSVNQTSAKNGAGSSGTNTGTWGAFSVATGNVEFPSHTNASIILAAYLKFTSIPTDVRAAALWMAANPGKMYPGWRGVT